MAHLKHLIVGYGEVGKAIYKIVGGQYTSRTASTWKDDPVDVVHICIPYSDTFNYDVKFYAGFGNLTIVHSSVPVGTCDALGVVHSPILGVHPHLEEGVRTFPKYFGGKNAKQAARIFKDLGLKTKVVKYASDTEAAKLWDTTAYGRMIMLEKEIYAWCEKNKRDFNLIYTQWTKMYNEGYTKLGKSNVVRPVLKHVEGPIGGHCVTSNAKLLKVKL